MKSRFQRNFACIAAVVLAAPMIMEAPAARASSVSSVYDMNRMLSEPHPWANQMGTRWQPAAPPPVAQSAPPPRAIPASSRQGAPSSSPSSGTKTEKAPATMKSSKRKGNPLGGILSEVRIGALAHDQGPFSSNKESGVDTNLELLFVSPKFLDIIWSPRPHVGLNANSSGDTSQVYLGLSYEWEFWGGWFAGFSLGGAYHNGETDQNSGKLDKKELGCPVLFRESIEAGYRFAGVHSLSAYMDHISNAKICDTNEGLENVGLRYGYRF